MAGGSCRVEPCKGEDAATLLKDACHWCSGREFRQESPSHRRKHARQLLLCGSGRAGRRAVKPVKPVCWLKALPSLLSSKGTDRGRQADDVGLFLDVEKSSCGAASRRRSDAKSAANCLFLPPSPGPLFHPLSCIDHLSFRLLENGLSQAGQATAFYLGLTARADSCCTECPTSHWQICPASRGTSVALNRWMRKKPRLFCSFFP